MMTIVPDAKNRVSLALVGFRRELKLTQEGFAKLLGVSTVTVARYETSHPPNREALLRISEFALKQGAMRSAAELRALYLDDVLNSFEKHPQDFVDFNGYKGRIIETLHDSEEWAYATAFQGALRQLRSKGPMKRRARTALKALS